MIRGTPFTSERQPSNESKRKPKRKVQLRKILSKIATPEEVKELMTKHIHSKSANKQFEALKAFGKHFTPVKQEQSGELNTNVKIIFENVGKKSEKKV